MSDGTHWRQYSARTVARHLDDPAHIYGAVRWNKDGTRALMRFAGPPEAKTHLTTGEARKVASGAAWRSRSHESRAALPRLGHPTVGGGSATIAQHVGGTDHNGLDALADGSAPPNKVGEGGEAPRDGRSDRETGGRKPTARRRRANGRGRKATARVAEGEA